MTEQRAQGAPVEEALQEEPYSADLLHAAFEASVDAIVVMDCDGVVRSANSAMLKMFGYRRSDVLGQDVSMLMPEPHRSAHAGYVGRYLETGEARIIGVGREVVGVRSDGSEFPLDLSVGEASADGERLFVGLLRDITERKRLQEELDQRRHELRLQRERLAHADRVAAIGQMAAGIAHEVNQPFGAIANYAAAARIQLDTSGDAATNSDLSTLHGRLGELLEKIQAQAHRGGEVVQRLRGLARHESGETEEVDLKDVVEAAVEVALLQANFLGLRIAIESGEQPIVVLGDSVQLQQVLLNLLRNALESVESHLSSEIDQRREDAAAPVVVQVDGLEDRARVLVRDRGGGIEESVLQAIMTPFVSSKSDGMGMGLAICDTIISQHGGHLWFRNHGYDGATFAFDLPLPGRQGISPPDEVELDERADDDD